MKIERTIVIPVMVIEPIKNFIEEDESMTEWVNVGHCHEHENCRLIRQEFINRPKFEGVLLHKIDIDCFEDTIIRRM